MIDKLEAGTLEVANNLSLADNQSSIQSSGQSPLKITSDGSSFSFESESSGVVKILGSIVDSVKKLDPRQQLIPGSKRASTLTVITSMVGGGTLTLPFGMLNAGFISTLIYFPLLATLCAWSLHGLILVGQKTNANTFYDIAKALYGAKVAVCVELLLVLNLMLASVAYLTLIKNLLPLALQIELHSDITPWTSSVFLIPIIAVLVISPLALMPRVAALRYASLCGFCFVIYLTCVTAYTFFDYCDRPYGNGCLTKTDSKNVWVWDNVDWYGLSWTSHFYTLPLIITSFAAHPTVLPIYIELRRKSPQEMWTVIIAGLSVATGIYTVLSTFGYLTFLGDTKADFLLNDYRHNVLIVCGAIGLCLVCALAVPLYIHAKRKSITTIYYNHFSTDKTNDITERLLSGPVKSEIRLSLSVDCNSVAEVSRNNPTLVETPELAFAAHRPLCIRQQSEKHPKKELPFWANCLITFTLLFIEALVSMSIENIGVVLAFMGSTAFPVCCYVFPTFALWTVHKKYPDDKNIDTKLLVIVTTSAILVSVFGALGLLKLFGFLN